MYNITNLYSMLEEDDTNTYYYDNNEMHVPSSSTWVGKPYLPSIYLNTMKDTQSLHHVLKTNNKTYLPRPT